MLKNVFSGTGITDHKMLYTMKNGATILQFPQMVV